MRELEDEELEFCLAVGMAVYIAFDHGNYSPAYTAFKKKLLVRLIFNV